MTEESNILFKSKPFVLGECQCGCKEEMSIMTTDRKLRMFIHNHHMRGERNNNYNGGRYKDPKGYWRVMKKEHHFADSQGYVMEHRLVWEEYHKACLLPWADVHHINIHDLPPKENIVDNTPENLEGMMHGHHTYLTNHIDVSDRICAICGGKTYVRRSGKEAWYKYNETEFLCDACHKREKYKKKRNL